MFITILNKWAILLFVTLIFSTKFNTAESFSIQPNKRSPSSTAKFSKSQLRMGNPVSPTPVKWCPEQQVFIDGVLDSSPSAEAYIDRIRESSQSLFIFGYGSLCWNPGTGILSNPLVNTKLGRALGYRRCWSQKSTDHRGNVNFPGLVCTILKDEEFHSIQMEHTSDEQGISQNENGLRFSMTEGVLFSIPPELVGECLAELDFREKGGYARDVVKVILDVDGTEKTVEALLYRGTPSNPAFSNRALFDELYTAAVMSTATGPSGNNDAYLYELDSFLSDATNSSGKDNFFRHRDSLTIRLADLCKTIQENFYPYFLYGSGSNQHNQLLLEASKTNGNAAKLVKGDEAHDLKEIVLLVPKSEAIKDMADTEEMIRRPKRLFAGGGHSALLTHGGDFYLWGWNGSNQLGRTANSETVDLETEALKHVIPPLDIKVETAALGHNHTLVIEKDTGFIYACGDDSSGQVSASERRHSGNKSCQSSSALRKLDLGRFVDVSAGLFHSAGVTEDGELVTFGCGRFGQTLLGDHFRPGVGKWRPEDGSRLVKVACGRRHTICLDEHGRVYSMGENKYGQLGRHTEGNCDQIIKPLEGYLGQKNSNCFDIDCGWSHSVVFVRDPSGKCKLYGFGRNDKHQLGFDKKETIISTPRLLFENLVDIGVKGASCGAESTSVVDNCNNFFSCGWNEHGNLGIGRAQDSSRLAPVVGAKMYSPYGTRPGCKNELAIAAGGGHLIATIIT